MTTERMSSDDDDYIRQAAAVPFRVTDDGRIEVLLIRRRGKSKWGIPKGLVDPGHTPEQTALIESDEEAGIEGELIEPPLGAYTYEKFGGACRVTVFAMRVTAERARWLEERSRERAWYTLEDAAGTVAVGDVGEMIRLLKRRLDTRRRPPSPSGEGGGEGA
jgi:phosphohistidine phosphatase